MRFWRRTGARGPPGGSSASGGGEDVSGIPLTSAASTFCSRSRRNSSTSRGIQLDEAEPAVATNTRKRDCPTDAVDGFLAGHRFLICDRDSKWTDAFRHIVQDAGVRIVLTPIQAPNANAYAECFVRSIREECLDRLILFGERRLLRVLDEFVTHDHWERNHQGLGNELIMPETRPLGGTHVRCRERLGGLLRYYHRAA